MAIDPIMLALMRRGGSGGGVSGAQADYAQNDPQAADYIKNRPGGYYDGCEITWDGEIGDRQVVNIGDGQYVKVSDKTFASKELIGGEYTIVSETGGTETSHITANAVSAFSLGLRVDSGLIVVIYSLNTQFKETGTYFANEPSTGFHVKSLSNKTLVKIPAELTTMEGGYNNGTVLFDGFIPSDKLHTRVE